ncbi:hypothetical protein [Actinomadura violacea]|uniref:Uncharacterized protein n=1 Tax=Actinomadura violacea TaxID=2819934 RepID=A0ABS3RXZ9_9ACTN|nr:hypothetical protein [Actinomadura violacea]MBO2461582.1 hypothetical protein [Actinomadura violacea]
MGAEEFYTTAAGTDPDEAFDRAVADAAREHGGRYTGTIAEKDRYVVVAGTPMDADAALALAGRILGTRDHLVAAKTGPAGAVAVSGTRVQMRVPVPPGVYDTDREAIRAAVRAYDFCGGRPVDLPHIAFGVPRQYLGAPDYGSGAYAPRRGGNRFRVAAGATLTVDVEYPAPRHTGWLFFGIAAR